MFAVPGWSVSVSQLKTQRELSRKEKTEKANHNDQSNVEGKYPKKRKRGHGEIHRTEVTKDNLEELWQRHVEHKDLPQKAKNENPTKDKKKRSRVQMCNFPVESGEEDRARDQNGTPKSQGIPTKTRGLEEGMERSIMSSAGLQNGKKKNEQRKAKGQGQSQLPEPGAPPPRETTTTKFTSNVVSAPTAAPVTPSPPPLPSNAKLTPLQTAMRAKLISARFRHLNQTLYTTPSTHASTLFSSNPEAFASYHAGFQAQVASWPSNPVDLFIDEIKIRGAVGGPGSQKQLWRLEKRKKGGRHETETGDTQMGVPEVHINDNGRDTRKVDLLPRHFQTKIATIIDLGCGDAHLHSSLLPLTDSLNLKLHSFDLAPGAGPNAHLITVTDIAKLPLADGSVDVAIFCLALMGTNWTDFVSEAARVVRVGGECWVGEVRSRFAGSKDMEKLKGDKGGKGKAKKRKKGDEEGEELEKVGAPILVEEEEIAGRKDGKSKEQETDVGPFVEVFRRRGFALKGEVDMGNRMFVRMRFARVRDQGSSGSKRQDGSKFVEKEDDRVRLDPEVEAKVLKPCVYKTR
ncbi:MAG: hypothetical protein Q9178_007424 [Gyalolechia marmorata]